MKSFEYRNYNCHINKKYWIAINSKTKIIEYGIYHFGSSDTEESVEEHIKQHLDKICHMLYNPSTAKRSKLERDFPSNGKTGFGSSTRTAVCKRCHHVMNDIEPCCRYGEFFHLSVDRKGNPYLCKNAGKTFHSDSLELIPFAKKSIRRSQKRNGIRP